MSTYSMETFVALAYDLAVLTKSPDDTIARLVGNVAAVFGALARALTYSSTSSIAAKTT
jgi:hypothetical protein